MKAKYSIYLKLTAVIILQVFLLSNVTWTAGSFAGNHLRKKGTAESISAQYASQEEIKAAVERLSELLWGEYRVYAVDEDYKQAVGTILEAKYLTGKDLDGFIEAFDEELCELLVSLSDSNNVLHSIFHILRNPKIGRENFVPVLQRSIVLIKEMGVNFQAGGAEIWTALAVVQSVLEKEGIAQKDLTASFDRVSLYIRQICELFESLKDVYYKDKKIPKGYYIIHTIWELTYRKIVSVENFEGILQHILNLLKDNPENWMERLDDAERDLKSIVTKPSLPIISSL